MSLYIDFRQEIHYISMRLNGVLSETRSRWFERRNNSATHFIHPFNRFPFVQFPLRHIFSVSKLFFFFNYQFDFLASGIK